MQFSKIGLLHGAYKELEINMEIHPSDTMYYCGDFPVEELRRRYLFVGETAVNAVLRALAHVPANDIKRILDFGCGGGRNGRHLRALFPEAEMYFSDLKQDLAEFCAEKFSGHFTPSDVDFKTPLPNKLDIIFAGSVFTHIDYNRMKRLFKYLFNNLSVGGALIATFHGPHVISQNLKLIKEQKLKEIIESYRATGVGYSSYDLPEYGDYGVSITSLDRVRDLADDVPNARLASYAEVGWGGVQDVAVWTRLR